MFESDPVLTYAFSIVTVVFGGRGGKHNSHGIF